MLALISKLIAQDPPADVFGTITPPKGVSDFNTAAGGADSIGALVFLSSLIRAFTIFAGIYVLFNIVLAGFGYVTAGSSGDTGAHQKAKDKLTLSIIGLVLIIGSYTIIGLLGFILTGDAGYFINPELVTPEGTTAPETQPGELSLILSTSTYHLS